MLVENEFKRFSTYGSSICHNGSQDFLIFQLIFNTFTMLAKHFPNTVIDWESEGLSN